MGNTQKPVIINIIGSGRSGSTVLDKALGGHPQHFSLGEICNFHQELTANSLCGCGQWIHDCPFWNRIYPEINAQFGIDVLAEPAKFNLIYEHSLSKQGRGSNLKNSLLRVLGLKRENDPKVLAWAERTRFLYNRVLAHTGAKVLVDSTKSAGRLLAMRHLLPEFDIRAVHLVRDGRAQITSSKSTTYTVEVPVGDGTYEKRTFPMERSKSSTELIDEWYRVNRRMRMLSRVSSGFLTVKHEDFTANPEKELARIAHFAGTSYDPNMLNLARKDAHMVCGNSSRLNAKEIKASPETWRTELPAELLQQFEQKAGKLNRAFGYR